jgi:simple sugar transport system ATP-binding protein
VVSAVDPRTVSARTLAEMMIGGDLVIPRREPQEVRDAPRLEVRRLSTTSDDPFATELKDVALDLRAGEILGIAGVAGNGQAELMAALAGETPSEPDVILIEGRPVGALGARARRDLGLAFVPEERLGRGAVPEMSLAENAILGGPERHGLVRSGLIDGKSARAFADRIIDLFSVVAHGHRAEARSLSGGNLQKFIIGREILQDPKLLIAAAPTWGVDAGAAAAIHQALIDLARGGAAVLVISQDLDELFVLCDRIAVMFHGRLSHAQPVGETSVEQIGLLMGGLFDRSDAGNDRDVA